MVVCKVALAVASTFTLRPGTSRRAVTSTWISGPKTTNIINFTYPLFYYCGYKNLLRMQRFVNFSQQMLHFWPLVWILGPLSINNKNWKKINYFLSSRKNVSTQQTFLHDQTCCCPSLYSKNEKRLVFAMLCELWLMFSWLCVSSI